MPHAEVNGQRLVHTDSGGDGPALPFSQMAQRLPDCRGMVAVEGAAHAPNLSHPQVVSSPLRKFLESLESSQV